MEDGGSRRVGYSLRPVLANDEEQETPYHPSTDAQCYITFMSVNRETQEFVVPSMSAGQDNLDIL